MKKRIFLLLIMSLTIGLGIYIYDMQNVLETHQSPDGRYAIIIKSENSIFSTTSIGDGGKSAPVEVTLENANGKVIGKSTSNKNCGVLWFSIEINWDLENDQVWYGRGKTINIKTGKVEC